MKRIAVIGAGLGGLSAAIRLAYAGYAVDVYEQQSFAGGKAGSRRIGAYRFDTGPSLLTMPEVFGQLFQEVGARIEDYLRFLPLNPLCRYFYPDGTRLSSYSDPRRFRQELQERGMVDARQLERYLGYGRRIYRISADLFLWKSLHELSTYTNLNTMKSILRLPQIDALRSLDRTNRSFFGDSRLVQLFDRYATYNGSDPYRAPATFAIIPFIELSFGGYAVEGGIYSLPRALKQLAEERGVRFFFDTRVDRILHQNGGVHGLQVGGEKRNYAVLLSNADVLSTYRDLLRDIEAPWAKRYRRLEPSSSGLVFYWGIKSSFPELGPHNIFFSSDYRQEFTDIFQRRICPREPTIYINISSKFTPGDAPSGGENWFVLINVPYHRGQDWDEEARRLRSRVLDRLEVQLGRKLGDQIEVEEFLTPARIEALTGSSYGSLYGIASNRPLAAFRRHPNRSRRYRGLYFCGGSAHPGGGMPLVLLSGKIAADLIQRYEGGTR